MELLRQEALVVPRTGPGGESTYDLAEVRLPEARVPVLLSYRAPLFPVDVLAQREKLGDLREQLRRRESGTHRLPAFRMPMLVTDSASSRVITACEEAEVALVDSRGTFFLRSGSTFIRVQGRGSSSRAPREPVFHGKGSRIVRVLLQSPASNWTVRALSEQTQTSYAYAHGVIKKLIQYGYVEGGRGVGIRLREPVGLLKAWVDSGRPTATSKEGFNAPSTMPDALRQGFSELASRGIRAVFTLASALLPEERFVSGVPHGLYLAGSLDAAVTAFGLRRMTPHNFWIHRADPAAETEVGGIYFAQRQLPYGLGVSLPQLTVDFKHSGGRGSEQAEELIMRYARALPVSEGMS
ncbi:hypothetical protein [Myxococcus sp. CA040A]|uniref:hypothetical protein n=1 Tax=Myxococcus sp. CA040A TaxID=2741738 RepID=UPI00352DE9F2